MILKSGTEWEPTVNDIRMWMKSYPAINLERELSKAESWLYSNPAKRKTERGMARFINSWLSRARPEPTIRSTRSTSLQEDLNDTSWANL
jgi:hypothetical protein